MRDWWKWVLFLGMCVMIVYSFITVPPMRSVEWAEASRIFYYHIPQAWICVIAFAISMIFSIRYLKNRRIVEDDRAVTAAGLGLVFCILATVSGSIFAKIAWGTFWNWDPRETSIFVLLLIYGAYFALRGAVESEERRAVLSAVYSIFAFVTVPFLIFVVPRMVPSLHPSDSIVDENMKFTMGPQVRKIYFSSAALFIVLFSWLYNLGIRVQRLDRIEMEKD